MVTLTLTLTLWPINSGGLTSLLLPHLSSSLTDSLPSLNLLCHSKTHARFMQDAPKAVWSSPYVSVAFFPSLKQNFIAYRSPQVSDCIFEIYIYIYIYNRGSFNKIDEFCHRSRGSKKPCLQLHFCQGNPYWWFLLCPRRMSAWPSLLNAADGTFSLREIQCVLTSETVFDSSL